MSKNFIKNIARPLSDLKQKSHQIQNNFQGNFRRNSSSKPSEIGVGIFENKNDQNSENNNSEKLFRVTPFSGRLIIARHGQTDLNVQKVWSGQVDAQITETGIEQARNLGKILLSHNFVPDIVLTTPLSRASRTAQIALEEMNCSDVKVEKIVALVELSPGDYTKKFKDQNNKSFTKSWNQRPPEMILEHEDHPENLQKRSRDYFVPMPFGESLSDVAKRTSLAFDYIIDLLWQEKKVLIVGHSNSLSALVSHFTAQKSKIKIPNAEPIEIEIERKGQSFSFKGIKNLGYISKPSSSTESGIAEKLDQSLDRSVSEIR